jgi:hypothetical protein
MNSEPIALRGIVSGWATAFSDAVCANFLVLLQGAILTTGRRTVRNPEAPATREP